MGVWIAGVLRECNLDMPMGIARGFEDMWSPQKEEDLEFGQKEMEFGCGISGYYEGVQKWEIMVLVERCQMVPSEFVRWEGDER